MQVSIWLFFEQHMVEFLSVFLMSCRQVLRTGWQLVLQLFKGVTKRFSRVRTCVIKRL